MALEIIPIFKWTFDQLLKLLDMDYKVNKDRFENVFDPTFSKITAIHRDYVSMINKLLSILPTHLENDEDMALITKFDNSYNPIEYLVETKIRSNDYLENIRIAKKIIDADRETNDIIRNEARALSVKIITKGNNKYEKRFSWSVINYFLNHRIYSKINEEDKFLERLSEEGSDKMTKTPSYLVSIKLSKEENAEVIRKEITNIKLHLGDKFTNVSSRYLDLKLKTYE